MEQNKCWRTWGVRLELSLRRWKHRWGISQINELKQTWTSTLFYRWTGALLIASFGGASSQPVVRFLFLRLLHAEASLGEKLNLTAVSLTPNRENMWGTYLVSKRSISPRGSCSHQSMNVCVNGWLCRKESVGLNEKGYKMEVGSPSHCAPFACHDLMQLTGGRWSWCDRTQNIFTRM